MFECAALTASGFITPVSNTYPVFPELLSGTFQVGPTGP